MSDEEKVAVYDHVKELVGKYKIGEQIRITYDNAWVDLEVIRIKHNRCVYHPSLGEQQECQACKAGSPPDLGVVVVDETQTTDRLV